jgi:RNA polymerase sigma-70 factor (ECF subfamily)
MPAETSPLDVRGPVERAIDRARSAHPDLRVDDEAFAALLGACVAGSPDPLAALDTLHLGDLLLAGASMRGDAGAVVRLERDCLGPAHAVVARILGPSECDDAMQSVRERLLVGREGSAPRLGEYAGRGSLAGWIKVVAVRTALNWARDHRDQGTSPDDDALLELPGAEHPELEHMRAQYRPEFKAAFQAALAALDARERILLRLQFVDDLTVDQIGALYSVHRSTAARWVARARESLFEGTRRRLAERLGLDASRLASILDLVRSHVDLSLVRLLEPGGEAANALGSRAPVG